MTNLSAIVRATRRSARALADIQKISRIIREYERLGDTAGAAAAYPILCSAQRRYERAQATLAANPLPSDRA